MPRKRTSSGPLEETLLALVRLLNRLRIPYMIMGGVSLSVWGRVRATQDVDVVIAIKPGREGELIEALQEAMFLPTSPRAILGHRLLTCRYLKPTKGIPVQADLFLARGDYQRQALDRAITVRLGAHRVQITAPEDLVLYKLLADRPIDRLDAKAVLEEQKGKLDMGYLRRWAKGLRLEKRLIGLI